MGLFMDGDGIPISFGLFEGARNEQPSLKPLETKLLRDFGFGKLVVCTDAGLASEANRRFNDVDGRGFIVTQSLKKLKEEERAAAMDHENWKRLSDDRPVRNFEEIRQDPGAYTDEVYYKERIHDGSSVIGQLMIVTYSPSYALYQKGIRQAQLERARMMVSSGNVKKQHRNQNDPARFVKVTSITSDGEVAAKKCTRSDIFS